MRKIKRHPSVNLDVGGGVAGVANMKNSQGVSDGQKSINEFSDRLKLNSQESMASQSGSTESDIVSTNQGQIIKRDLDAKNFIGGPSSW